MLWSQHDGARYGWRVVWLGRFSVHIEREFKRWWTARMYQMWKNAGSSGRRYRAERNHDPF